VSLILNDKKCGSCTKCCEGTLKLIVHGQKVQPGKPCHLLNINSGCSDYENRPAMPCRVYKCIWLKEPSIPQELQPNIVNLIIHKLWVNGKESYTLLPAGEVIEVDSVKNIFAWFKDNNKNFSYIYDGVHYICGTDDFIKDCYNKKDNT